MPRITIIGGPNGAGKTLFARELLSISRDDYYVNADVIARGLVAEGLPASKTDARAAREMLNRIDELIAAGNDFMLESTLASRSYAQRIPAWRAIGYHVALIYVRLPSAEHSLERVQKRVNAGGTASRKMSFEGGLPRASNTSMRCTSRLLTSGRFGIALKVSSAAPKDLTTDVTPIGQEESRASVQASSNYGCFE